VKRAIDSGRIVRKSDGRIDQDQADADWLRNTQERCPADGSRSTAKTGIDGRREAPARGDRAEFRRGADWLSNQVNQSAHRVWPPFVREHLAESPSDQVRLIALLCETLETWPGVELRGPDATSSGGFLAGAKLQASAIIHAARQTFPRLAAEIFAPDDQDCAVDLSGLILRVIEGWLENYLDG
jgi:hypothetical protein